jgi:hypothetical protein
MLRIDETSGTLVAPEATLGPDVDLDRDELLRLLGAGWSAFAAEIGQPGLQLAAEAPAPGVDVLAVDGTGSRMTVVSVAAGLEAALQGAATVASWDGDHLASVHPLLAGVVPGDSPRLLFVAASFDDSMLATVDWLARRHAVEAAAHHVQVLRFGAERLIQVVRAYPAAEAGAAAPDFLASVAQAAPVHSAPPPGVAIS